MLGYATRMLNVLKWAALSAMAAMAAMAAGHALASPGGAGAAPPYIAATWGVEEGLPQHVVSAVLQTRSGDLWCATYHGLARFDGVNFTVFDRHSDPPLSGRGVTVLFEDPSGALWAGLENGAIHRFEGIVPLPDPVRPLRAGGSVRALAADGRGDLWALWSDARLERLRDGLVLPMPAAVDLSGAELDLLTDSGGQLWLMHRSGMATVLPGGLEPAATGLEAGPWQIQRGTPAARGGLWVIAAGELRRWDGTRWAESFGDAGWKSLPLSQDRFYVSSMLELKDGRLLLGLASGGAAIGKPGEAFQLYGRRQGLLHDWVRCLAEDHEGNLWLGTGGGGLTALRPRRVTMQQVTADEMPRTPQSLSPGPEPEGGLWVATEGAGLYWLHRDERQHFQEDAGITSAYVWTVLSGPGDEVWAGTWNGGLYVRNGNGLFTAAPGWPEVHPPVKLLHRSLDGALWAGGSAGIARYQGGTWTRSDAAARPWSPPEQQAITEDATGALWMGMGNGDLIRRQGDDLQSWTRAEGLPGDGVISLYAESPDTVWAGTAGGGLVRLQGGRIAVLTMDHGLPGRLISQLLPDRLGHLWAGTYQGLCRMALTELHACADGGIPRINPLLLQRADGMASMECINGGQPGACATPDGRLWFPTSRGLAVVDPARMTYNPLPPPVRVEALTLDGQPVPLTSSPLRLGPGAERVSIDYTALSFTAPDRVRFRTRLSGLESAWQEAGSERRSSYRYLPPGDYLFEVMACNNDGVWNPLPASVAFTLRPQWWQRHSVQILSGFLGAGLLGSLVWATARRRNATRLERLERVHALERERARIARDIHDDLGSGLTRIMLLSESAASDLPAGSPAAGEVEAIRTAAGHLTQAMDEIVWAVDPRHDTLDSLVGYVGSAAQEYLRAAGLRFRLEAPGSLPPWPLTADRRHSLFLAFREALHNVVRHARARTVRVLFAVEPAAFTLTVEDDGQGFDPAHPAPRPTGGRGLTHMIDRLTELGGTCQITSQQGHGTRVTFRLPIRLS